MAAIALAGFTSCEKDDMETMNEDGLTNNQSATEDFTTKPHPSSTNGVDINNSNLGNTAEADGATLPGDDNNRRPRHVLHGFQQNNMQFAGNYVVESFFQSDIGEITEFKYTVLNVKPDGTMLARLGNTVDRGEWKHNPGSPYIIIRMLGNDKLSAALSSDVWVMEKDADGNTWMKAVHYEMTKKMQIRRQ